jgi:hypothetical protein
MEAGNGKTMPVRADSFNVSSETAIKEIRHESEYS